MAKKLPEYQNPPVTEVALSVTFSPLEKWKSAHSGLYWSKVLTRYPLTEVYPELPHQIENFDDVQPPTVSIQFEMFNPDNQRYLFLTEPSTRVIQVQRDRFVTNWRQIDGDEPYPRYRADLRPSFEQEWGDFQSFLTEQKLGSPDVKQCEVTYVNDVASGAGWNTFDEALNLFAPWWNQSPQGFLPTPENLNLSCSFAMEGCAGRLHVNLQRAKRSRDGEDVIHLQLTARGKPDSSKADDVLRWMDIGHDWIVQGFTDLTSANAHKLWGRTA